MLYFSASTSGFYDSDIHSVLPEDAVEITKEEHMLLLDGQSVGKRIVSDGTGKPTLVGPIARTLDELKTFKLLKNNKTYEEKVTFYTSSYPQMEKDTWPTQAREIMAWQADSAASTPWIDIASTARGIAREDYIQRTLNKLQQFEQLSANLTGLRQKYEDQIKSATSESELEAIILSYEIM